MTQTKTINGQTWYTLDGELWWDDPAKIGRDGLAWATFELPEIRADLRRIERDIRDAKRGIEVGDDLAELERQRDLRVEEIQILEALTR